MDNKVTGRATAPAKDVAAFGGGGGVVPEVPGAVGAEGSLAPEPEGDVEEGPGAGLERGLGPEPVLEGGLAVVPAVTLMANFCPKEQC